MVDWREKTSAPASAEMLDQEPTAAEPAQPRMAGVYDDLVQEWGAKVANQVKQTDAFDIVAKGMANAKKERHTANLIHNARAARYVLDTKENEDLRAEAMAALPETLREVMGNAMARICSDLYAGVYHYTIVTMKQEAEKLLPKHKQAFEDHAQDVVDDFDAKLTRAMEGVEAKLAEFLVTIDARVESAVQMIVPGSFSLISKEPEPDPYDASEL